MLPYLLKPLFVLHANVHREAEWWEFHRDKTTQIVFPPPLVEQLSLAHSVFLKETLLSTTLLSPPRGRRRIITFTPKSRNTIWLASRLSVPNLYFPWNIIEVKWIFSEWAVRWALNLRFTQCNHSFILNNPPSHRVYIWQKTYPHFPWA